jgi:transcriptional regulator with XRE-family HTH domain
MFKRERLREILNDEGRRQDWLASKIGLTPESITRYLTGTQDPNKAYVLAMAFVLKVDPSELWEDTPKVRAS